MYRQGDILLIPVDRMQGRADELEHRIVERGELTGHVHKVDERATLFGWNDVPEFVVVNDETELAHEEHETIVIPEGTYRIQRQREFDGNQARFVTD